MKSIRFARILIAGVSGFFCVAAIAGDGEEIRPAGAAGV
jgi:hypothetical protein